MELFSENKHPHPLIYMRGLKLDVLLALLDFFYLGEANIWQEKLDEFLALAAELKLKGLGGDEEQENEGNSSQPKTSRIKSEKETQPTQAISSIQTQLDTYTYPNTEVEMAQQENNAMRTWKPRSDQWYPGLRKVWAVLVYQAAVKFTRVKFVEKEEKVRT